MLTLEESLLTPPTDPFTLPPREVVGPVTEVFPKEHSAPCPAHLGSKSLSDSTALPDPHEGACQVQLTSAWETNTMTWSQSWKLVQCLQKGWCTSRSCRETWFRENSSMLMLFLFRLLISAAQRNVLCCADALWRFGLCCFASCLAEASELMSFFGCSCPNTPPQRGSQHLQAYAGGSRGTWCWYRVTVVQGHHPLLTPSLHVLCVSGHSQTMDVPNLPQSLATPRGSCHHRCPKLPQTSPCWFLSPNESPPTPGGLQPLEVPTSNCISVPVLGSMGLVMSMW